MKPASENVSYCLKYFWTFLLSERSLRLPAKQSRPSSEAVCKEPRQHCWPVTPFPYCDAPQSWNFPALSTLCFRDSLELWLIGESGEFLVSSSSEGGVWHKAPPNWDMQHRLKRTRPWCSSESLRLEREFPGRGGTVGERGKELSSAPAVSQPSPQSKSPISFTPS